MYYQNPMFKTCWTPNTNKEHFFFESQQILENIDLYREKYQNCYTWTQIHDLRNRHCGVGIWYEIYCRCSDYLTLRGVGIWETEASAVERLCKAKYRTKIDCKITWNICVLFAKLRQGGGCGNFQVVSERQNMSTFYFAQFPYRLIISILTLLD